MPIKTQDELRLAEDQLRIAMMRGYAGMEEQLRQAIIDTVSDGDTPENIRSSCSRLLEMKFVDKD